MPPAITHTLAETATDPALVRDGISLLFLLAIIAALLVPGLVLILVLRRHYLAQPTRRGARHAPTPDPWQEAGRRAVPIAEDEDDSGDLGAPGG